MAFHVEQGYPLSPTRHAPWPQKGPMLESEHRRQRGGLLTALSKGPVLHAEAAPFSFASRAGSSAFAERACVSQG